MLQVHQNTVNKPILFLLSLRIQKEQIYDLRFSAFMLILKLVKGVVKKNKFKINVFITKQFS
jgi:hypothetical protein